MNKISITKLVTESQLQQLDIACDNNFIDMSDDVSRLVLAVVSDFIISAEIGAPILTKKTDRIQISSNVFYGDFKNKLKSNHS